MAKRSHVWKFSAVMLFVLLVVSVFTSGFGIVSSTGNVVEDTQKDYKDTNTETSGTNSLMDDDAVKGDPDAPVTIVEWSDFECPFCARFYSQTLGLIEEEYIKTGKVKIVYRDFPLSIHPQAEKAAEAAECAGEQGKYWEMHNILFEKGVTGGVSSFKDYAKQLGLNADEFNDCLDSGRMADEIKKDMADGQKAGITGTPGFLINGQLVTGAQPFSVFQQVIDSELAKSG